MKWSSALQVAIDTALHGNLSVGVYDEVQPDAGSDYVVIGETTERPDDTHSSEGSEETVTIHVISAATDSTVVKGIMAEITTLLHNKTLAMSTGVLRLLTREFAEVFKDQTEVPGQRNRHGVMRFRATIEEG